ncbi:MULTISPECIES: hypothetical protein [unclassified Clostridium]|uniref:hypothetical protein n=1 Tax=unclassified Clostridium TaxID=2614128 RepID=UPI0025C2BCA8|nr:MULTISPECIES: hypothetical protein [unclassified Clostridium]
MIFVMQEKLIKTVEFVLENCETVIVPYNCFKLFKINRSEPISNKQTITHLDCVIEISKDMKYGSTCSYNFKHPFYRLHDCNDITQIELTYEDNAKSLVYVDWREDVWTYSDTNKYQMNTLFDYNTLHIHIE